MPSALQVLFCSIIALLFWGTIGMALSRRWAPPTLAIPIAPALGWAVHSALALPLYRLIGFTPLSVLAGSLVFLLVACLALRVQTSPDSDGPETTCTSLGLFACGLARRGAGGSSVSEIQRRCHRFCRANL